MLELLSAKDLYEDEDLIVVEGKFKSGNNIILCKDVQIKDRNDDVVVTKTISFKRI